MPAGILSNAPGSTKFGITISNVMSTHLFQFLLSDIKSDNFQMKNCVFVTLAQNKCFGLKIMKNKIYHLKIEQI